MTGFTRNSLHNALYFTVAAVALPWLLNSSMAHAEGSFLLQLGTFESREEAQRKWDDVKAANGDVVGRLQGHVAEVMLPPDNTPSYRMQLGPVDTRKQAKALCKTLEQRNVNCLLVETAFAASDLSPEMIGEASPLPRSATPEPAPVAQEAPRATSPEEQITTSAVPPVENVAPAPAVAARVEEKAEHASNTEDSKPGFFGRMFGSRHESARPQEPETSAPVPEKTSIQTAGSSYSNPNDVKKPAFFRSTFRFNHEDSRPVEAENNSAAEAEETKVAAAPREVVSAKHEEHKPDLLDRLFGSSSDKEKKTSDTIAETSTTPVKGDVEVAEAIRVPVTETEQPAPARYETVADTTTPDNVPLEVVDTNSTDAYWIQITYFKNEARAHAFYSELRVASPERFSSARIRINRPFGSRNSRATLRMGPFTSQQDIRSICSAAQSRGLRCTTIRDENNTPQPAITSTPESPRKRHPSPLEAVDIPAYRAPATAPARTDPASPAQPSIEVSDASAAPITVTEEQPVPPAASSDTGIGAQWVSLGVFATSQEAWGRWKSLQSSVPALQNAKPAISGMLGDGNGGKFQLRAGPFETDVDAEKACESIVKYGNNCYVMTVQ